MIEFFNELTAALQLPLTDPLIAFALILFIILASPILLQKVNTPGIIGLIIAGIIIGPHGMGIISAAMLDEGSALSWFASIGLLYIMFIAGLELDMGEFKANRYRSLIFGFYTFSLPLAIGYPVCRYILDFSQNASLLTASMFATHTLVAYPIVSKLGVARNRAVAITVGGTILTDTAVLMILAIVLGQSQGQLDGQFWIQLAISLAIFSFLVFRIVPIIATWFFRNFESEKHSHYIFVLGIMFLAAFLADISGLEGIIGAFAAGLALNKLIPASSALMNRIEFIGNSLFIPFFLIQVGMLVDVQVALSGSGVWWVAFMLTLVAIMGKWLAALLTQLSFRFSGAQRRLIFGLSGAHAAATLAVIMVGHQAGILDDTVLNGTIILILVTSTLASFATEHAGRKLAQDTVANTQALIDSSGISDEQLLLPVRKVTGIDPYLEFASLIKDKDSPHPISVLSVVSTHKEAEIDMLKAKETLAPFVEEAAASDTEFNVLTTIDAHVSSGIARVSREIMADLIILGWPHQAGFYERIISDRLNSILSHTYKTALICRFIKPLGIHKKLVIAVPPQAEQEMGFSLWLQKLLLLARELSNDVTIYCSEDSQDAITHYVTQHELRPEINFKTFNDWNDFLVLSRYIGTDDLFVLVSARNGAHSYQPILDVLPTKIETYFPDNNYIVVYPQHAESD